MVAPKTFTPELIANGKYRYEETDEPVASIAVDFDVSVRYFRKLIVRWNWKKHKDRLPRDLSPALQLELDAEKTVQSEYAAQAAEDSIPPDDAADGEATGSAAAVPARPSVAERLEQEIAKQLAAVERMRTQSGGTLTPANAERTARTLASLSETLLKVQRLRSPDSAAGRCCDCDDLPRDLDEFRRVLALRIEAFVRSRMGEAASTMQPPPLDEGGGACGGG